MTRWLTGLIAGLILFSSTTLAFDIPYGVQDPFHSLGFPPCDNHNQHGPWAFVERIMPDGRKAIYLVILSQSFLDPANIICWVDGRDYITCGGKEKQS